MADKLEQFAAECSKALKEEPGPPGREKVRVALESVLTDGDFVKAHLGDGTGTRDLLYEDPDLGFCIFAHAYEGASESSPHDHGSAWAIYGQAVGETEMTDWELVEAATEATPGKVRRAKRYALKPGMACVYNEGQLHSPRREDSTRLIRIEGQNMDGVKRLRFEPID